MNVDEIIKTGKTLYEVMRSAEGRVSKTVQLLFEACSAIQKLQAENKQLKEEIKQLKQDVKTAYGAFLK